MGDKKGQKTEHFPSDVALEAAEVPRKVKAKERRGRKDYRKKLVITIDSEDTKDIDDAISVEPTKKGYKLGVHIADVSHYVKEGSALDAEAMRRGTSTYLVDRVIPMLPRVLSNGICSLNEGEERLTLSCVMKFDDSGQRTGCKICESVIKSRHKMTYDEVQDILDNPSGKTAEIYSDVVPMLKDALQLSLLLRKSREERGAVDFDFPECKITLDKSGRPVDVRAAQRKASHLLIEDFMLAANEAVAEEFFRQGVPFIYRVHDRPDADRMAALSDMLSALGAGVRVGKKVRPKDIQDILVKTKGSPDEAYIKTIVLRSMQRAIYSPECRGHFGLADEYYCHFTSPIRRYPDLMDHRIIKAQLHGRLTKKYRAHFGQILPGIAELSSNMEREAEIAERESEKKMKARYMEGKLGEVYTGKVSGITSWGIYVALPNTVEGLIFGHSMRQDHFIFDEKRMTYTGKRTGRQFRLGDEVTVRVVKADRVSGNIDFLLYEKEDTKKAPKEGNGHGGKKRSHKAHRKQ